MAGGTPWWRCSPSGVFAIALAATGTFELLLGLAIVQVLLIDSWRGRVVPAALAGRSRRRSAYGLSLGADVVHRRVHGAARGDGSRAA